MQTVNAQRHPAADERTIAAMRPMPGPRMAEDTNASYDEASEIAPPVVGYRVPGDLEIRAKQLEQELIERQRALSALEQEVFAMRRKDRARRALDATAKGGLGAVVATLAAMVAYAFDVVEHPKVIFLMILIGLGFGALLGMRWDPPDDGFPKAPPTRYPGF